MAQVGSNDKKTGGRKSRWTVPFNVQCTFMVNVLTSSVSVFGTIGPVSVIPTQSHGRLYSQLSTFHCVLCLSPLSFHIENDPLLKLGWWDGLGLEF